jgi:hypothetical protein
MMSSLRRLEAQDLRIEVMEFTFPIQNIDPDP